MAARHREADQLKLCRNRRVHCQNSNGDRTKRQDTPDIPADFLHAAAEEERLHGHIVIVPVENFAARAERLGCGDGRTGALGSAMKNGCVK
jgi:hypothetical protein